MKTCCTGGFVMMKTCWTGGFARTRGTERNIRLGDEDYKTCWTDVLEGTGGHGRGWPTAILTLVRNLIFLTAAGGSQACGGELD